jgi:sulfopyruvate decarboxylase subunit beta
MTPADVIAAVARHRGHAAIVTGPGAVSGALYGRAPAPATIYNMDLGYPAATALGVALGAPAQRVVAIEGDGSALAGIGVLTTIARYRPANLAVIVIDNGAYGSTGDGWVRTATSTGTDLAAVARACGIDPDHVLETTADRLDDDIATVLREPGPWVLVARVDLDPGTLAKAQRPRTGIDWADAATAFRHELERRAGHA